MKKLSVAVLLTLSFLVQCDRLWAQCSPSPGASGTTFAFGVTDSVTPLQFVPSPFIVCDNGTLYYHGNNPDTVYLEGSARLVVATSFNLVVFMRNNCQLRLDSAGGMHHFDRIVYDPTFTTFVDTAGIVVVNGFTSCPGMSYTYSNFPNAASPCAVATSAEPRHDARPQVWTQPVPAIAWVELPSALQFNARLTLWSMDGREMLRLQHVQGPRVGMDIAHVPPGIYLLQVETADGRLHASAKLLVQ